MVGGEERDIIWSETDEIQRTKLKKTKTKAKTQKNFNFLKSIWKVVTVK